MRNKLIVTAAVLFMGLTVFAQNSSYDKLGYKSESTMSSGSAPELSYEVRGNYERSVTREKLGEAVLVSDFIAGYPVNWITDYVSVEILAVCNGKSVRAVSPNDILSPGQKNILNTIDPGTGILIKVKYKSTNVVTDNVGTSEMNVSMMIIPEVEAEYSGGQQQLKKYLKENLVNRISEATPEQFQKGAVVFTVNEGGEIVNTRISKTSGDVKTDKLLVEAISKMPKWKPAQNSKGVKVKQEFEFSIGARGC